MLRGSWRLPFGFDLLALTTSSSAGAASPHLIVRKIHYVIPARPVRRFNAIMSILSLTIDFSLHQDVMSRGMMLRHQLQSPG
jgi:hypothetical protein